jgi:hypothetical protein
LGRGSTAGSPTPAHCMAAPSELAMRSLVTSLVLGALCGLGCPASGNPQVKGGPTTRPASAPAAGPSSRVTRTADVPADRRVWAYVDGQRRAMDIDDARSYGLTIVDLSDDWVPYIFWSRTPAKDKDDYKENDFLDDYADLANDRIDVDGVALAKWEHNYFEVYGVPPSLSVLRRRFMEDETRECYKSLDYGVFKEYFGPVRITDPQSSERELKKYNVAKVAFGKALRQARVKTLEQLLKIAAHKKVAETYQAANWRHQAILEMQKRIACEGMYGKRAPKEKPGILTWTANQALRTFERKHNIYGWGMIFQATASALGRTPRQNNFESLKRAIGERVVSAAGILEDGTVGSKASYKNAKGAKQSVRNLVDEFAAVALKHMGLTTAERALAFMREHQEKDFDHLFIAVPLPPVPDYYSNQMDLHVVIDRGDVWYDFPFDEKGRRKNQPRAHMPHFTLSVRWNEQSVPLVRWQTTIGGWQPEMRHEQEYYKYKISDVGPRIWKNIVAGPVWVPPPNTPSRDMVKFRSVRGSAQSIVAHQAFGPGYASAYGLVAAFHVTKNGHDNQVRTHGSVNYMSILSSFSHGCHRLFNFRAVRLFSFVLRHRSFARVGQSKIGYSNRFEHKGEEFHTNLNTRGYYYELKPPVPVNVLEGNIKGEKQEPITEYVKKPNVTYSEDIKIGEEGGDDGGGGEEPKGKKPGKKKGGTKMIQPTNL